MTTRLRYAGAALLGALIRAPRLNAVVLEDQLVRKRRRGWACVPVALAQLGRLRFRTLTGRAWHAQERLVGLAAYGDAPLLCGEWLVTLRRPGRVLAEQITLVGVAAALRELRRLHQLPGLGYSHADATVYNVTYDPASGRAWWFDFETAHDPQRPACWRQADDLRALVCSAAALLPAAEIAALGPLLIRALDTETLAALRAMLLELDRRPDPAHLAQTRLCHARWRALLGYISALTAASAAS